MTDIDFGYDFDDYIRDLYKDWLDQQVGNGPWNLYKEAWDDLWPEIRDAVNQGRLAPNVEQSARKALRAADDYFSEKGKKLITRERDAGQEPLDIKTLIRALVPLGKNDRVLFGDMGFDEWLRADQLRYGNLRAVQNEYDAWRRRTEPFLDHMRTGLRVTEIYERGLVDTSDVFGHDFSRD